MNNENEATKKKGGNLNFLFVVGLIVAIIVITFTIQNNNTTTVNFFSAKLDASLALLIISSIFIGAILAFLFSIPGWWRRRKKRIQLETELATLKKNYSELASINKPSA